MKKYIHPNRHIIFLSLLGIALITVLLWPTEMSRRDDKIDELYGESLDNDTKKYHHTQREIDSIFNVIDTEYTNETSHSKKMDLQYQRAKLQRANSMNNTKLTDLQLDSLKTELRQLQTELDSLEN